MRAGQTIKYKTWGIKKIKAAGPGRKYEYQVFQYWGKVLFVADSLEKARRLVTKNIFYYGKSLANIP